MAFAVSAFASLLIVVGCRGGSSTAELPAWIPEEIGGVTIGPTLGADPGLTREDAIAVVRKYLGARFRAYPTEEPLAFPARITGVVHGAGSVIVSPTGEAPFPRVENKLAWLLIWRAIEGRAFDPPMLPDPGHVADFVVFVDAGTGEVLYKVFLSGDSRLR